MSRSLTFSGVDDPNSIWNIKKIKIPLIQAFVKWTILYRKLRLALSPEIMWAEVLYWQQVNIAGPSPTVQLVQLYNRTTFYNHNYFFPWRKDLLYKKTRPNYKKTQTTSSFKMLATALQRVSSTLLATATSTLWISDTWILTVAGWGESRHRS